MTQKKKNELLSTAQAATLLKLSDRRVRKLCSEGRLGTKVGGAYAITRTEINQFLQRLRPAGNPRFHA